MAQIAYPEHCKTFTTPSSSTNYDYVHIPPSASKSTIVFLHGFPSSSYDWRHQISYFSSQGYGILAPDLLGYGGTDKPSSPNAYAGKKMATEVIEILDHENLDNVHAVSHDFGSHLLSKIINYFPNRLQSCTFIAVPYAPPGQRFDLDAIKALTEQALGFEKFGYMRFMNRDDASDVLDAHNSSFTSLLYTSDYPVFNDNFYPPGHLESWLKANKQAPQPVHVTPAENETHDRIFSAGGYRGPTNWYRALVRNLSYDDEHAALIAGTETTITPTINQKISCPVLGIDSAASATSLPGFMENSIRPYARDARFHTAQTEGHWVQIESRNQVNAVLEEFLLDIGV